MADDFLQYKSNLEKMSSNQVELKFMVTKLRQINKKLGNSQGKKSLANSQFDFLQQSFLSKRYAVQQFQDTKQKEGITLKNANIGQGIRDGIVQLKQLAQKLRQEYKRLVKKKKQPQQILQRKGKIVQNCENLLKDIQEREQGNQYKKKTKVATLTDMKARLLKEIDENNDYIHGVGSDGVLTQKNEDDDIQLAKWKKKDQQIDVIVDEITAQVKGLRGKVQIINEHQEVINDKTKKADKKAQQLERRIKKDNDQLKTIIQKMKPASCCMYLSLFLLAVGLVVCIIKLLI